MEHMGKKRPVHRILIGKPEVTIALGRPTHCYMNSVTSKIYLICLNVKTFCRNLPVKRDKIFSGFLFYCALRSGIDRPQYMALYFRVL